VELSARTRSGVASASAAAIGAGAAVLFDHRRTVLGAVALALSAVSLFLAGGWLAAPWQDEGKSA
jgi:hypothetical protein